MRTISCPIHVKARISHSCSFCGFQINPKEVYMKSVHEHEGEIYDWKSHLSCNELTRSLDMYDYADEGITSELFQELVYEYLTECGIHYNGWADALSKARKNTLQNKE